MTNKQSHLMQLKATAAQLNALKAEATNIKSLTNTFAWQAYYILANGFLKDKLTLQEMVKKDQPLHSLRGVVSKAKAVLQAFEAGMTVELKDIGSISQESLVNNSFDNLPEYTLGSIYAAIKKADKHDAIDNDVTAQAQAMLEDETGQTVAELLVSLPEAYPQMLEDAKHRIIEANKPREASPYDVAVASLSSLNADELEALKAHIASMLPQQARRSA